MRLHLCLLSVIFICCNNLLQAQDSDGGANQTLFVPNKLFSTLNKKSASIEKKLKEQTNKYLSRLRKSENKIRKKLWKKDSILAKQLFEGVEDKYTQLQKAPENINKYSSVYSGHLDSLTTSLNFLKGKDFVNNAQLEITLLKYSSLQQKLNQAGNIKKYLNERQKLLKQQLESFGMVKELKAFQKQAYYYQAQVREYRELFEDPSKMERKVLELVMEVPRFKEFFTRNSILGALFPLPDNGVYSSASVPQGLQTRASVNQSLIDRFGSGSNITQMLQQNMQAAQAELSNLKNKVNQYGSGSYGNSSTDLELPEGFTPNRQRTKNLFERLEYGANVQTAKSSSYFPVTSDLGLSLGYKINDKSSIGVGVSHKLGWGSNWDHIRITHQGVGVRSYIDMKLKGSLYLSGGYEQNYRTQIKNIDQLRDFSSWQSSGLVGLSKKYKLKGKLKGSVQLLWDFLSYQQTPKTQAILFRLGYSLK